MLIEVLLVLHSHHGHGCAGGVVIGSFNTFLSNLNASVIQSVICSGHNNLNCVIMAASKMFIVEPFMKQEEEK